MIKRLPEDSRDSGDIASIDSTSLGNDGSLVSSSKYALVVLSALAIRAKDVPLGIRSLRSHRKIVLLSTPTVSLNSA